ncbi:hypothetical protein ACFO0J_10060 [Castellaniella hirudinis]|uniref:Cthe-2314-like HEPN domain-containing protein n=1 Tax=Castellaniella hirudinis TaxID=1144617 RepID=A0ABV8RYA5_9BURK
MEDTMASTGDESDNRGTFQALVNAVSVVANESIVLSQYETAMAGAFATLWPPGGNHNAFEERINRAIEHLGSPPKSYIVREGSEPPPADNYPEAAMREVISVFSRARKSVIRAHMFRSGSSLLTAQPDLFEFSSDRPETQTFLAGQSKLAFWEHAEAAYIRLYSFWDRVGQVLDFAFFNIRKFDQNGFTAVMDRIHANAVPMNEQLRKSGSWKKLRTFQTSEKDNGLKWLLQRRNLVVHTLHLHPLPDNDESVFKSQFNHLEVTHREKLRPRDPCDEVAVLLGQLNKAAELFGDLLTILEMSPSRKQSTWVR